MAKQTVDSNASHILLFYRLFVLTFIFPLFAFSQTITSKNFTINDGLPSQAVRCIYKDSRGLLWVGTDGGVSTFDGKNFETIPTINDKSLSMIWSITEDNDGNIWFGSYGDGVYKYNGDSLFNYTEQDGLADNFIRVVCNSKHHDCVIASSHDGIYNFINGSISSVIDTTPECQTFCLITDIVDGGDFLYLTDYGHNNPLKYFPEKNRLTSYGNTEVPYSSFAAHITSKGDTILGHEKIGVKIFQMDTVIQNMELGQVFGIDEDKHGNIWFTAWTYQNMELFGGVFMYDGNKFHNYNSKIGITERGAWTVYCDKEQDIIWIGTTKQGLFMIPNSGITNYPSNCFNPDQNKINNVFIDSDNQLWICGSEDLSIIDADGEIIQVEALPFIQAYRKYWTEKKNKILPPMQITKNRIERLNYISDSEFLNTTQFDFQNVRENVDNTFIITNDLGVYKYDLSKNAAQFITPYGVLNELEILEDTLFFSGWSITCFLPQYEEKEVIYSETEGFDPPSYIRFTEDGQPRNVNRLKKQGNTFWFASWESGLWMRNGNKLINFNKTNPTITNNLTDLCFDQSGNIIFSSNIGEIYIAAYHNDSLLIQHKIQLTKSVNGQSIRWLITDQKNHLWIGTNKGINCINLNELYSIGKIDVRIWNEEDGYIGHSSDRVDIDKEGNLWIAANENLIKIETSKILKSNPLNEVVSITKIEVNNLPIDGISEISLKNPWTSLPEGKYKLKHTQNDLIFHFDLTNYLNPNKDQFRYKLVGYDRNWSSWSNERKAVYTNLPFGNYEFLVESYNLQTLQMATNQKHEFKIKHPWWRLLYIQLAIIIGLLTITIYATRRITLNKRIKQEEKYQIEKKIIELEIEALQAKMNPHFIFNCMNNIQYYILDNKQEEALRYLSDFSKVVRFSLENTTLSEISLDQEISYLNSYIRLEHMRFPDKFDYTIDVSGIDDLMNTHIPPSLIQPFIENSIKHGFHMFNKKGVINISFEPIDDYSIKCSIEDNGNGRGHIARSDHKKNEAERLHSTSITETRIKLFNTPDSPEKYRINFIDLFKNEIPCGLKVEIIMPVNSKKKT